LGIGTYCKDLSTKEGMNRLQTSKILTLLSDKKWHDVDDQTVRKAILQWKRRLAAVAKQNEGPIQHISAS